MVVWRREKGERAKERVGREREGERGRSSFDRPGTQPSTPPTAKSDLEEIRSSNKKIRKKNPRTKFYRIFTCKTCKRRIYVKKIYGKEEYM